MDKVIIYYSREKDTMDIWFGNPDLEVISEEAGDGVILKKDKDGKILGVEKLYVKKTLGIEQDLPVELIRSEFVQRLYKNWKRSEQLKNLELKFFKDSEIVLRYNDFPYPFEYGVSHFVLWIHPKLNTDLYLGSRMPKFYKNMNINYFTSLTHN